MQAHIAEITQIAGNVFTLLALHGMTTINTVYHCINV